MKLRDSGRAGFNLQRKRALARLQYEIHLRPGFSAPEAKLVPLLRELGRHKVLHQRPYIGTRVPIPKVPRQTVPEPEIYEVHGLSRRVMSCVEGCGRPKLRLADPYPGLFLQEDLHLLKLDFQRNAGLRLCEVLGPGVDGGGRREEEAVRLLSFKVAHQL